MQFIKFNISKILLIVAIFTISFVLTILLLFPYDIIAKKYIDENITRLPVNLTYSDLDLGLFGGEIRDIVINDQIKIDHLNISYNPISLLFLRVSFNLGSDFLVATGKFKSNTLSVESEVDLDSLSELVGIEAIGAVNINANYFLDNMSGNLTINSGSITFKHPLMKIETDSLHLATEFKGFLLKINNFKTTGKSIVDATGIISFNSKKIKDSILDIKGSMDAIGIKSNFEVTGTFSAPNFKLN